MKKILFTANLESFFTKFLIPQLKWFKENGYEVHVAAKSEKIEIPYCDKVFDVDFARGFSLKQNITSYKQLCEILKNDRYDIISCHTPFGGAITRLAAKKCAPRDTRVVYMAHGFHFYKGGSKLKNMLFYTAEKFLAKYTDAIITINMDDYEIAKEKFCCDVRYVSGVGLDKAKFDLVLSEDEKCELRKSLGLSSDDFIMIYPAELSPPKRHNWLMDTLKPLLRENPNFHLLLPGKDSLQGACQQLAKELDLEKQVHFLGFRRDIPKLLKIADLSITSSCREGLPVNVMEAIYEGLPVVATACRGNRDLIETGKNGFIVPVDDKDGFRRNVMAVYGMDGTTRDEIKEYDKTVINRYLLENVLDEIIKIYTEK